MKSFLTILISIFTCLGLYALEEIELNTNWQFRQVGTAKWYSAEVPGVIHTDLLRNKLIDNPYWENNELKQQWIGEKDWEYKCVFKISDYQLNNENIEIDFEGLDTYATVELNGKLILKSNNMFRSWQKSVKRHLHVGENTLLVTFRSPLSVNRSVLKKYPYVLPSGCETGDLKVGSFTRKAAYHFGWDWGPRFVTAGIWRPVKINLWNSARITNVNCQTILLSDTVSTQVLSLTIESSNRFNNNVQLFVNDKFKSIYLNKKINILRDTFQITNPKLWWCNGMGEAHLEKLDIRLEQGGKLVEEIQHEYGIRTIELVQEKDSIGTSYYFKLNGMPVFMKGANYIPQDMFLPRVTLSRYEKLIDQVKKANMNMLRVWGGGIYENDIFYNLCDKNGILIWQDFMFAGSLYPANKKFINNIEREVTENIKRLRHHPCIALWCGNNEIEVAWKNWGWQKQYGYSLKDSVKLWSNYQLIFHNLIPGLVRKYDSESHYVSTSPISNWGTAENFNHSSMHYWGVWHGKESFEQFNQNVGRFMVEYGFQSFPSIRLLRTIANDSSLHLNSEVMANRQKSYIGNGLILEHIETYFQSPATFVDFVELSQKTQAIALGIAIRAHLNHQPHCMGSLFWQLNDCWPGPSWSVIEYDGHEKIAYDTIANLFSVHLKNQN